ncbi:amiloride-sensitive sodium channel subunit alpha-like [Xenia sp. Carnegie-2017]|uniref:amiloride-sensitive sodium channel subunit alpha-like n=1 Tax=Xenia sp. Carnegie-2017 TaxID=2897299 RepID=UPI001F03EA42|nr:amiloride-sensitive sodium channel subunit alpha-like [Xenia sp. Carnegie-2017]
MTREDFQDLGNQKNDFIASCTWQGTLCDPSYFEVFQNYMYGNCFTFNTSKVNSSVSGTGPYNGLSLFLFLEQEEYMDRIASAAGARVTIHEFHFKPQPEEEGFYVAPGFTTSISLRKMTTQTVKPICDPNKKTTVDNEKTYSYSRTNCMKKCLSDEIIRQCNCAGTQFFLDMKTCSANNETEGKNM